MPNVAVTLNLDMANRCLYIATIKEFLEQERLAVLGALHNNYHGEALTTTDEAWMGEIDILQQVLQPWKDEGAQVIFEYEIPRMGKRVDVVLLLRGIIFCLEFKVGQRDALQADVEQVMDYALDLKNFHRFSHDKIIVPILIPTNRVSSHHALLSLFAGDGDPASE
jgi:hypothetical protein